MKFSYVLPDPMSYREWDDFDNELESMKELGYDAVELQIADPADLDQERLHCSLKNVGYPLCAFQTGISYYTRGNCLCSADESIRVRTIDLLKSFVELAERFDSVIVFGSLQGRTADETDLGAGRQRILEAMKEVAAYATSRKVIVAFEPVNHLEVAYNNTIAEVGRVVRDINVPGLQLMVDTFHMNIEEKSMIAPLESILDLLVHVHLSETNRDVLGTGHWDTASFLKELGRLGYSGYCSIGVYNTRLSRADCLAKCMQELKRVLC